MGQPDRRRDALGLGTLRLRRQGRRPRARDRHRRRRLGDHHWRQGRRRDAVHRTHPGKPAVRRPVGLDRHRPVEGHVRQLPADGSRHDHGVGQADTLERCEVAGLDPHRLDHRLQRRRHRPRQRGLRDDDPARDALPHRGQELIVVNRWMESWDYLATADIPKRYEVTTIAANVSIGASGRNGTSALHLTHTNAGVAKTLDGQATWYTGFWVKLASIPSGERTLLSFYGTDGTKHVTFAVESTGLIMAYRGNAGA